VLSAVESCQSYEICGNGHTKELELRPAQRKCLHYYAYWIDPQWGWMHTRLQTWLPFPMWHCLNGRHRLACQLDRADISYIRRDNCFTSTEDCRRAQKLADSQLRTDWPRLLNSFADRLFPRRLEIIQGHVYDYFWSVDESEWATDVLFRSREELARVYPAFLQHAIGVFQCRDVLRFLGRAIPEKGDGGQFGGRATARLAVRPEGVCVKHYINDNSIKMYDKQASVLRIETTINNPYDFRVPRAKDGDEQGKLGMHSLRKGVVDTHRRAEVSQRANERYLEGLAAAKDTKPLADLVDPICQPTRFKGRRVRALQPFQDADTQLLLAISHAEFLLHGFRNRELQKMLYDRATDDPKEQRRRSGAVTRQIRMLRAHGLIRKIPSQHRYQLSEKGQLIVAALLAARKADAEKLVAAA
jgi:hypothetical protein